MSISQWVMGISQWSLRLLLAASRTARLKRQALCKLCHVSDGFCLEAGTKESMEGKRAQILFSGDFKIEHICYCTEVLFFRFFSNCVVSSLPQRHIQLQFSLLKPCTYFQTFEDHTCDVSFDPPLRFRC